MNDELRPPFGRPAGRRGRSRDVLDAYARNEPPRHSGRLHVEGAVLLGEGTAVLALRLAPGVVLARVDPPDGTEDLAAALRDALGRAGLELLDEQTLLGTPVALQLVGLRISEWDLWGDDIDAAFARLRAIATG